MKHGLAVLRLKGWAPNKHPRYGSRSQHNLSHDHRERLSRLWIPRTRYDSDNSRTGPMQNVTALLADAGYIRQSHAGIYQFLPLGLRVLSKVERLIDYHMRSVGASKLSLSSISSQKLWESSGRLTNGSEIFKFEGRNKMKWLLAPTHEEEITTLLKDEVFAELHLPIRLYQIGRKYRDEQRPRGGLLRGREFIMKDLYTFDATAESAQQTYEEVRQAYNNFFEDLSLPYAEVRADSGNMGGDLSHEFHFLHDMGEDTVIHCPSCGEARNTEFVPRTSRSVQAVSGLAQSDPFTVAMKTQNFLSTGYDILVRVIVPQTSSESPEINPYAVKEAMTGIAEMNTGLEPDQVIPRFKQNLRNSESSQIVYIVDKRVTDEQLLKRMQEDLDQFDEQIERLVIRTSPNSELSGAGATNGVNAGGIGGVEIDLVKPRHGDKCSQCNSGRISLRKAIEIGHTFHLGTRYSSKLGLEMLPKIKAKPAIPVEMGCHGIGVSRLIAATAAYLSQDRELRWPTLIAPYNVLIGLGGGPSQDSAHAVQTSHELYDRISETIRSAEPGREHLQLDVVLDDRQKKGNDRLREAILTGYSVIVLLGKSLAHGKALVTCTRAGFKEDIPLEDVPSTVKRLLDDKSWCTS